jgi:hypothetical protein
MRARVGGSSHTFVLRDWLMPGIRRDRDTHRDITSYGLVSLRDPHGASVIVYRLCAMLWIDKFRGPRLQW